MRAAGALAVGGMVAGCNPRPARIVAPKIDAPQAAAAAVAACDQDGDGQIALAEAARCPSLTAAFAKIDADRSGQLTAEEIAARIASWSASGIGITTQTFFVLLDGKPLAGGRVQLVPESFLADALFPAESGISDAGMCTPTIAGEHLPEGVSTGIYFGLYRVLVTHPDRAIPGRYHEATELGMEVCPDYNFYNPDKLQLKSR